jgi:hypothetical protein
LAINSVVINLHDLFSQYPLVMASPSSAASSTLAASPTGLPDGISAPLETISDSDKGGLVAILAAFALSLVLVSFPIRTYVRSKIGKYKMDDYAFVGASVHSLALTVPVYFGSDADTSLVICSFSSVYGIL